MQRSAWGRWSDMKVWRNRKGQAMVEYVLVFLVILLAIILGSPQIKAAVGKIFKSSESQINKASTVWDGKM